MKLVLGAKKVGDCCLTGLGNNCSCHLAGCGMSQVCHQLPGGRTPAFPPSGQVPVQASGPAPGLRELHGSGLHAPPARRAPAGERARGAGCQPPSRGTTSWHVMTVMGTTPTQGGLFYLRAFVYLLHRQSYLDQGWGNVHCYLFTYLLLSLFCEV